MGNLGITLFAQNVTTDVNLGNLGITLFAGNGLLLAFLSSEDYKDVASVKDIHRSGF